MSTRILMAALAMLVAGAMALGEEIKGQVFIVTKGGPSIKLALAKVYFLSLEDIQVMQQRAKVTVAALQEKQARLERAANDDIQTQLALVEKAQLSYEEKSKRYTDASGNGGDNAGARFYKAESDEARTRLDLTKSEVDVNVAKMKQNLSVMIAALKTEMEMAVTTPPEGCAAAAITDADGEFLTAVPPGKSHVLIHAARQQPREVYRWLVPLSEVAEAPARFLFSNHNLRQQAVE